MRNRTNKARAAREHEPVTIERLERALAFCALLVMRDGPVVIPLFERLERDLAEMRAQQAIVERAMPALLLVGLPPWSNSETSTGLPTASYLMRTSAKPARFRIGLPSCPRDTVWTRRPRESYSACVAKLPVRMKGLGLPDASEYRSSRSWPRLGPCSMRSNVMVVPTPIGRT